jgi:hypothetical protein
MSTGWIECDARQGRAHVLSPRGRKAALPYALCARDVYPDCTGKDRGGAEIALNWIELLHTGKERALGVNLASLRTFVGRLFGFNAALYKLPNGAPTPWALSFEGSATLAMKSPRDVARAVQDWLLTNAPTTLDVLNYLEQATPGGLFTRLLNPRQAPSNQYDIAHLVAEAAMRRVGASELALTGHSLGGGLASYAAARTGGRAVVFNSAGVGLRCALGMDMKVLEEPICHLATTSDPALGRVLSGFGLQAAGALGVMAGDLVSARTNFATGKALAQSSASTGGQLVDQMINRVVTTYTDVGSRHLGSLYVLGVGGHGMDDVIKYLG